MQGFPSAEPSNLAPKRPSVLGSRVDARRLTALVPIVLRTAVSVAWLVSPLWLVAMQPVLGVMVLNTALCLALLALREFDMTTGDVYLSGKRGAMLGDDDRSSQPQPSAWFALCAAPTRSRVSGVTSSPSCWSRLPALRTPAW